MAKLRIQTAPGEGERRAQRGYVRQYESAAAAIYAALERDELIWVGLADRNAGVADDVVLCLKGGVVAHQFKTSRYAQPFRLETLLLGADGLLQPLVLAWQALHRAFPNERVEIRLVTNDYPSSADVLDGESGHSASFLQEFELHPGRTLADWRAGKWQPFVDRLVHRSGVDDAAFEQFLQALRILWGPAADFAQAHRLSPDARRLAGQIASLLPRLVADVRDRDRWTRSQLLEELGWPDSFMLRRSHQFPVGAYVQRNAVTERALRQAINEVGCGYVALIGSPGAGKSTLLQSSLATEPALIIVRYLAFVPGEGQGIGRGEAEAFLDDVNAQLKSSGLVGLRFRDTTLQERRDQFEKLLKRAGERFQRDGVRTLIIVDGLDHIPREEVPQRSLLAELPLPHAVPRGVLFLLGTQRLDLDSLAPAIQEQASLSPRKIVVEPLSREAVYRMIDSYGLDPDVSRERIYALGHGQPLVTRYLIEALRYADDAKREALLAGEFTFEGDIETIYASAWREINDDAEARDVMSFIARAEGPIQPEQLADAVSEQAVERALTSTAHLLSVGTNGWAVFHNSFRLFILSKPRLRFGKPDPDYAARIYVRLAELARAAAVDNPQRWLELRYLARALRHMDVLALAKPARFREQLADGRPASEIDADIRLAFGAALAVGNPTDVFRLLLAQDEIGRRSNTLEYAPSIVDAMLALGDVDGAQSFAEANGCDGYKIVDVLLRTGEVDRARAWFDRIEPLERLWGNQSGSVHSQESGLKEWAKRVFHFREVDQINDAIERLSNPALARSIDDPQFGDLLRFAIARAAARAQPTGDLRELARQLKVRDLYEPYLLIEAGLGAQRSGDTETARALLSQAVSNDSFSQLPDDWRAQVARSAAELGDTEMARTVFAQLAPPAIFAMEEKPGDGVAKTVTLAVVEYVELATLLGETLPKMALPKRSVLQPLQHHAVKVGDLLGRARSGYPITGVELVRATHDVLAYLERAEPTSGDEFYAVHQLAAAAPVLAHALIQAAALCGEKTFADVVAEFDRAFAKPNGRNGKRIDLRRKLAAEIYHQTGDFNAACQRLEPLVEELREDTPDAQVEGLAVLAATFASIGENTRARQLLQRIHNESLGYALAPKKDAQYSLWRELLQRANAMDPGKRQDRVELTMRLLDGMMETEGRASGYRIASAVLSEAASIDAATGLAAARKMAARSMLSWAGIVNALLLSVVRRSPYLAGPCATAWASLALPYYSEPHYRSDKLGEFISTVIAVSPVRDVDTLIDHLCMMIEANAQPRTRVPLLERLIDAMSARGMHTSRVDEALIRWRAETPVERDRGTPGRYDNVASLSELEARLREEARDAPDFEGVSAYERLVATAELREARSLFERWPALQNDTAARFALVRKALLCGEVPFARSLVEGYRLQANERATWNYWSGAGRLKYFQARLKIEGAVVHDEAYADLVGELAGGREHVQPILFDIDDIFPTIAASPNWAAMWEALAGQLTMMREYAMGAAFELPQESGAADEDLIVSLYRWALSFSLFELTSSLRRGALHLLSFDVGTPLFALLVKRLLEGEGDEPAEAVQLLLHDAADTAAVELGNVVASLVDHPDYAVAVGASRLLKRWGQAREITHVALPFFYEIHLDDGDADRFERPKLSDSRTGAMHVEDPLGWTFAFSDVIRPLARHGVSVSHIRERCRIFIESWGGLAAFGPSATAALEASLRRIDMQLTYTRPHMAVALRALRHVAGEMRLAGLLREKDEPWLLHLMGYSASPLPLMSPCERPRTIPRPAVDRTQWRETDERWLEAVDEDVRPLANGDGTVIAEFARFNCRDIRTTFVLERIRVPFCDVCDGDDLLAWMHELPQAIWVGSVVPLSDEPAATIVRRFQETRLPGVPYDRFVICPFWLRRLSWRQHSENRLEYLDSSDQVVARIVWWRDGGPTDIGEDGLWGEGGFITLTPDGCQQIESITRDLKIHVYGRRTVAEPGSATEKVRRASAVE